MPPAPVNPEAYEAYLKGRYFLNNRSSEGIKTATGYFEQAITIDSRFALAYAGLADCYSLLGSDTLPAAVASAKARTAALKALDLNPSIAEAPTIAPGPPPTNPIPGNASSVIHEEATVPPRSPHNQPTAAVLGQDRSATPAASEPAPVRYFGDYEIIREIARGGMGSRDRGPSPPRCHD